MKRVHCIIFLSVGHWTKQYGYCAGVRTIDRFTQVFHDIVVLYRAFGKFPGRPALREEVVDRIDNEQSSLAFGIPRTSLAFWKVGPAFPALCF